jgi:2,4-dienoyl-CoA reductase (NADPH2)
VRKAAAGRADEINTCIACNQACLDHVFEKKTCSCLVNPRACREAEFASAPAARRRRLAVVGAGPAGVACAATLAERGHEVELFEAAPELGGQFNLAKRVPGKEEFAEALRYFRRRLELSGARLRLGERATAEALAAGGFEAVVLATGVVPRDPHLPGQAHPMVLSYLDVLGRGAPVGRRVAIVGAGGIGFDVAQFLVAPAPSSTTDRTRWLAEWGVLDPAVARGGVGKARPEPAARQVYLLQRTAKRPGQGLGRTTGWIHRAVLKAKGVELLGGVRYLGVDDRGLTIAVGEQGASRLLEVDNVVLCAGQEPRRELEAPLRAAGLEVHLIGGADVAAELDAKRAIEQGTRLGLRL